ncbi:MAG: S8 family serine peptidase, partial [Actinomycetota bacterium]|nr:S8 family serine peptidase [Actinomycetota bacterium]
PDAPVRLHGEASTGGDLGSTKTVAELIEAPYLWERGYTGAGIGVALVDSGTVPVQGLEAGVVHGPDLSFEGGDPGLRHLDTYGHGTHLAGIIAGRDPGWSLVDSDGDGQADSGDPAHFAGIAPDATLVSVKVATANGTTDVSQVIAAIDWVVQHRNDPGLNIRVLNLAFGTDGIQDYTLDPLAYAVEVAWSRGIVVVAAAGNEGFGDQRMNNPAYDPFVIAVGANDLMGTKPTHDDQIPDWSSRGDGLRNPDLVAPGASITSLRDPGSHLDLAHPGARVDERFFRGSGTSQASASVSGGVALLLQQRPALTPDQVKSLVTANAVALPSADPVAQGSGLINLKNAARAATPDHRQSWVPAAGLGLMEAARGSLHPSDALVGEVDASGALWDAYGWSAAAWEGSSWAGGSWSGTTWSGGTWNGDSWSGDSWSGDSWSADAWSSAGWG